LHAWCRNRMYDKRFATRVCVERRRFRHCTGAGGTFEPLNSIQSTAGRDRAMPLDFAVLCGFVTAARLGIE
jgi:hypothetical protein